MMATCKVDRQWSGKKMEFGEGLKTLECLRGRLLAERQASRSAKEEADFMGEKLIELEKQIRKETELRNKAERRLQLLIKKLESLNIASVTSEISTNSSATKESEDKESRPENLVSTVKQRDEKKPNRNALDRANSSPNSRSPNNSCTGPHRSSQIHLRKDQSFSVEVKGREREHYIDDLKESALPGAAAAAKPETGAMKTNATDVHEALKHIRGNVRSSFERRNHMKAIISM